MYRKNLPIITGKFPAKINRFNCSKYDSGFWNGIHFFSTKGSRFSIAAFLLLITAFLSVACETPGSVGNDIVEDDENVLSETLFLDDYSIIEENSFSGRLANTPVGYFEDPLFGTINSVALLKPSITTSDVDSIREEDSMSLRLVFDSIIYGDSLASSEYEIYEVGEIWRGAQLRYNNEVSINMANKVADFEISATQDTMIVELSDSWTRKFAEFFNPVPGQSPAVRDSTYINNFPGLAIVPSRQNKNIRFLKTQITDDTSDDGEEEVITSFLHESMLQDGGDEDEDDSGPEIIDVRDWGASFTREGESNNFGDFFLHNSERALKIHPNIPDKFSSKNIVNAQLILSKNINPQKSTPGVVRPNTNLLRAHVFDEEPSDVMAEIFTSEPNFATSLDDTSNAFLMNITQFVLDDAFGDVEDRLLYLTIQSVNGLIYSTHFFDPASDDLRKPRIVITYVDE